MRAARIVDDVVIETADLPSGVMLDQAFPPELGFVEVAADVEQGMVRAEDGGFAFPPAPTPSLEELRDHRRAEVNALRDSVLAAGYQHNFGGTAGIRTLDNRDERDAINWLGLSAIVERMIANDEGATLIAIRDAQDATFTASAQTVSNALYAMAAWRSAVLTRSWALKDEIAAAEDADALAVIDLESDWPG